jgi:hypothetical protein
MYVSSGLGGGLLGAGSEPPVEERVGEHAVRVEVEGKISEVGSFVESGEEVGRNQPVFFARMGTTPEIQHGTLEAGEVPPTVGAMGHVGADVNADASV